MNKIKKILLYIWQLPQHLLGLALALFFKQKKKETYKHTTIFKVKKEIAVSLGNYIFMNENWSDKTKHHEYGHSLQSIYLGPLYLLIVGLPSITMNIFSTICYEFGYYKPFDNYYKRFPENWADKLGKVKRD